MYRSSRVGVLVAAVLAMGIGGCGDDTPTEITGEHLVVSIGDSVASGEGNPDRGASLFGNAAWQGWGEEDSALRCHRSRGSAPAIAAAEVLDGDEQRFVSLACSGATIPTGLRGEYEGIEPSRDDERERPQLEVLREIAAEHSIDAVLISIGANDVGFAKVAAFCANPGGGPCQHRMYKPLPDRPQAGKVPVSEFVAAAIKRLPGAYRELDSDIPAGIERRRVVIAEYFDPTSAPVGYPEGQNCRMFGGITPAESRWAQKNLLVPLNAAIAAAADAHRWTLVDAVDERFRGHGLCARERDRWVVTGFDSVFRHGFLPPPGLLFDRQALRRLNASIKGTLHPNPAGHREIAALIEPALRGLVTPGD